ncbi:hypothetical protein C7420_101700 [Pantoea ananatis]|uniref:hypothetical protein n=1 Tax=Pantoea ananas TaxID=553 RepID=UPI000DC29485|nr:hypothetical protein [Pantoea ananatis]RAR75084.1 hypothetical protein C7420_101700 [Pantoea ananatis]
MKIVGIDMDMSSSEQGLGARYLKFDIMASVEWKTIFEQIHRNTFSPSKRDVSVVGSNLIVHCCMDELQHQIESLNKMCAQADERLVAKHQQEEAEERERVRQVQEKRTRANEHYGKLKF